MSDSNNTSLFEKKVGGPRPTADEVSEQGTVQSLGGSKNIFERCLDWARLDTGEAAGEAGRWSNAGKLLLLTIYNQFSTSDPF